jgi:ABC-type amino acid transport substrate-binding protein
VQKSYPGYDDNKILIIRQESGNDTVVLYYANTFEGKEKFMKKTICFCLMLSLLVLAGCVCSTQKNINGPSALTMLTEEYPPVTFMKDGKVTGFVTDVVREIIARQGIPDNIRLTSWDEAYNTALNKPNVVLFSTERTEKREKLFQWVGPVGKNSAIFYAKKGSGIRINSLEDARKIAAIATTTDWFTEQFLKSKGFTNLVSSPLPVTNVKQLMNGEVQISIFTDITIPEIVKNAGYGMADLEPVFTVSNTYFYIAVSPGTPVEVVKKWQSVLDGLKADGTFEKIYRRYLPNAELADLLKK